MQKRKIPNPIHRSETKNKILDTATEMFALKGYNSVSLRDIADAVGIKIASIYNHYKTKQEIMDDILLRFESGYRDYLNWLSSQLEQAQSLDEIMDVLFNEEFLELEDPKGHLGMSFIIKEQHEFEPARNIVFTLFHEFSIQCIKESLEKSIGKGIIPPLDMEPIARMLVYHMMVGCDIRVHELAGVKTPVDCKEMYGKLKAAVRTLIGNGG